MASGGDGVEYYLDPVSKANLAIHAEKHAVSPSQLLRLLFHDSVAVLRCPLCFLSGKYPEKPL